MIRNLLSFSKISFLFFLMTFLPGSASNAITPDFVPSDSNSQVTQLGSLCNYGNTLITDSSAGSYFSFNTVPCIAGNTGDANKVISKLVYTPNMLVYSAADTWAYSLFDVIRSNVPFGKNEYVDLYQTSGFTLPILGQGVKIFARGGFLYQDVTLSRSLFKTDEYLKNPAGFGKSFYGGAGLGFDVNNMITVGAMYFYVYADSAMDVSAKVSSLERTVRMNADLSTHNIVGSLGFYYNFINLAVNGGYSIINYGGKRMLSSLKDINVANTSGNTGAILAAETDPELKLYDSTDVTNSANKTNSSDGWFIQADVKFDVEILDWVFIDPRVTFAFIRNNIPQMSEWRTYSTAPTTALTADVKLDNSKHISALRYGFKKIDTILLEVGLNANFEIDIATSLINVALGPFGGFNFGDNEFDINYGSAFDKTFDMSTAPGSSNTFSTAKYKLATFYGGMKFIGSLSTMEERLKAALNFDLRGYSTHLKMNLMFQIDFTI